MEKIDRAILGIDKVICDNISHFDKSERGLLSQNILSQLRNFVEYISLKAYSPRNDVEISYENITKADAYIKTRGELRFLSKFYKFLEVVASHYTLDEENSERLMLKYYEYLLKIRSYLKITYDFTVLNNIDEFPINIDSAMKEYYEKIVEKIKQPSGLRRQSQYSDRYYIQKIKPFFVGYEVYYEVTFTIANDRTSKFDRLIAFTKFDIPSSYAVKLALSDCEIEVLNKKMPIQIIDNWEVSIRPCELNNFAKIFGENTNIQTAHREYRSLMEYLTKTGLNLVEVIDFSENNYQETKSQTTLTLQDVRFYNVLDKCHDFCVNKFAGNNVIRYLLYKLNNKIIKQQYKPTHCERLTNLCLEYGCIPFDEMPFNTSLINHNPRLSDLFECIDPKDREYELFARYIKNNAEIKGQLYTPRSEIEEFENIDDLMQKYNEKLYMKHGHRRLEDYKKNIYIKGYEEDTFQILKRLKDLSSSGIKSYSDSVNSWLQSSVYQIDSEEKKEILTRMFENSKVGLVYGSAGTGKTTLINHISNYFHAYNKLYLANTNPAVQNLNRRVNAANCTFKTVTKFLSNSNTETEYDMLVIDECSTVSNSDMFSVLQKATFKLLVLVGDVFQIESIRFGNWFSMAKTFVSASSVSELIKPYRSDNYKLLELWKRVRNIDEDILEHITKNDYSISLDESIFDSSEEDEIILCLNYDGLYGINNINRFLQGNNKSTAVQWGAHTYKVNDPILFNETDRFTPLIYNNQKGKIVGIKILDKKIQFEVELDRVINEFESAYYDFELMDNSEDGNSIIRFYVNKFGSTDEDDDSSLDTIVPFQVAYAVSIHKAQGLEYNSVKIVITNETEESITHNIFYTAITRAKEKLKIYWTPEAENKILSNLEKRESGKDSALLSSKYF